MPLYLQSACSTIDSYTEYALVRFGPYPNDRLTATLSTPAPVSLSKGSPAAPCGQTG